MKVTKKLRELAHRQREETEAELVECKKALRAVEEDLEKNWNRQMIYEPAQREKERRAKLRTILSKAPSNGR